jgi:hypothetical protein
MKNTFEPFWQHFAEFYVPPEASEGQVRDTRAAYYSGAMDLLTLIDATEPEAANELRNDLVTEFNAFVIACRADYRHPGEGEHGAH